MINRTNTSNERFFARVVTLKIGVHQHATGFPLFYNVPGVARVRRQLTTLADANENHADGMGRAPEFAPLTSGRCGSFREIPCGWRPFR